MELKIKNDLNRALKEKEETKVSVLKMLLASVINTKIKLGKKEEKLTDEETLKVIKSEAKKRHEAIDAYSKADRADLAEKEKEELKILESYLPEEMPDEEIKKLVEEVLKETKAESMQDFGNVMKGAMAKVQGQADGKRVSEIVKTLLVEK